MANNLASIKKTAYESFYTRLGSAVSNYTQIGDDVVMNTDTYSLQLYNAFGVTHFAAQVSGSDPTAENILSTSSTVTSTTYEKLVRCTEQDALDNPDLVPELAKQMADAGASSIASTFWTAVATAHNSSHPNTGKVDNDDDSAITFIDAANQKILASSLNLGQSNQLAVALSSSALSSNRAKMQAYKNDAGLPINADMSSENLCLVVPAALATTARDLVALDSPQYASDLASSVSGSYKGMSVVVAPYLDSTDENNWWLFHKRYSPIRIWIRKAPTLRITTLPDTGHISIYASGIWSSVLMPHEMGVIGNIVA